MVVTTLYRKLAKLGVQDPFSISSGSGSGPGGAINAADVINTPYGVITGIQVQDAVNQLAALVSAEKYSVYLRGNYDASTNLFPTTGGGATGGDIDKGDLFIISNGGTLGGIVVNVGDSIIATINIPGQTLSNWLILPGKATVARAGINSDITSIVGLTGKIEMTEQVVPTTPAATKADLFLESDNGFSRLRWVDSTGLIRTIGRDTIFLAKNISGSTIAKGIPVYVSGQSSGRVTVDVAIANSLVTSQCLGITLDSVANNSFVRVMSIGFHQAVNTTGLTLGAPVYLSSTVAGGLTSTPPTAFGKYVARLGVCTVVDATVGSIELFVRTAIPVSQPLASYSIKHFADSPYTINPFSDYNIFVDLSAGPVVLNLPNASLYAGAKIEITVENYTQIPSSNGNACVINATPFFDDNSATTRFILYYGETVIVKSCGVDWHTS